MRAGTRTVWRHVPEYLPQKVLTGYKTVTREEPVYEWQEQVVGHKFEEQRVPNMVEKQVKVGTRVKWTLVDKPRRTSSSGGQGGLASIVPEGNGPAVPDERGSDGQSLSGGFDWGAWKRADMAEVERAIVAGLDPADRKFRALQSSNQPGSQADEHGPPDAWQSWAEESHDEVRTQSNSNSITSPLTWLRALWTTMTSPDIAYQAATAEEFINWAKHADDIPNIYVPTPIIRGFGMDEHYGKPLAYVLDSSALTRMYGRTIGDISNPTLFVTGLGITLTPNLIENLAEGAPWNETWADVLVDGGGYLASEGAGILAAAITASSISKDPLSIFAGKMVGDISAGTAWEIGSQSMGWNESLSLYLKHQSARIGQSIQAEFANLDEEMERDDLRVATPEAEASGSVTATVSPESISVEQEDMGSAGGEGPNGQHTPAPASTPEPVGCISCANGHNE